MIGHAKKMRKKYARNLKFSCHRIGKDKTNMYECQTQEFYAAFNNKNRERQSVIDKQIDRLRDRRKENTNFLSTIYMVKIKGF